MSPVLTRLYTPADFGLLAFYSSALSVLAVLASLRFELALPLPEDEGTAVGLLWLSLLILLGTSLLTGLGIWGLQHAAPVWIRESRQFPFAWLLPLGLLGTGIYQVLNFWAVRQKAFAAIAQTRLNQSLIGVAVQIGLGLASLGPLGLLIGEVVGRASGSGVLARRLKIWRFRVGSPCQLTSAAARYSQFPRLMIWAALFNTLALQIPMVVLPRYLGLGTTGVYFLAYRVLTLPVSVLSAAVAQVFLAEVARNRDQASVQTMTRGVATLMCALGAPIYLGMVVVGPDIFALCFGDRWEAAGACARIMAPALLLRMVATTLSTLLTIGERYAEALFCTAIELAGTVWAVWIGVQANSITVFVLMLSLISVPFHLLALWRFSRVVSIRLQELLLGCFGPVLLLNVPVALLLMLLKHSQASRTVSITLWAVLSVLVLLISLRLPGLRSLWATGRGERFE
jgi:O-antigen/teichoic acid export membrane protein